MRHGSVGTGVILWTGVLALGLCASARTQETQAKFELSASEVELGSL